MSDDDLSKPVPPNHDVTPWQPYPPDPAYPQGQPYPQQSYPQQPYGQGMVPPQPTYQYVQHQYVQASVPVPAPKTKLAAGLLGIFLGGLGIHRFYLGYTGIGVTMLLITLLAGWFTCGIAPLVVAIWGFIEGIVYLASSNARDAQGRPLV
ncbi:TM2 domain-containing protein [Luteimicrobium subarcticum]|uniref:TM2 domain-containing protein n=1 Tax=Luteimicrobium subarcticum TaxID=620910 RepID=A0A2M8WSC2_9MICO|nr:TM2 domain-containing protein [Luteimicrobium subarcticum]PJI93736.1 TM2 domain-containing protein [Luteimicrobium subarcticum]